MLVVEIEEGIHRDEVQVRFPICVHCSDVPPILQVFMVRVDKFVGVDTSILCHSRNDVFPEVVTPPLLGVGNQMLAEDVGAKQVDPHRGKGMGRVVGDRRRLSRFL